MKPYFGATNNLGQWWDGKNWANPKSSDWLKTLSKGREAHESGLHLDGVFDCPRCRRTHFIVDNYDLLCDGCANTCLEVGSDELKANIESYREKARNYWRGAKDSEIADRIQKRNAAWHEKQVFNESLVRHKSLVIKCKKLGIPIESTSDYKLAKQFTDKLIAEGLEG